MEKVARTTCAGEVGDDAGGGVGAAGACADSVLLVAAAG